MTINRIGSPSWAKAYWAGRAAAKRGINACPFSETGMADAWWRGHKRYLEISGRGW